MTVEIAQIEPALREIRTISGGRERASEQQQRPRLVRIVLHGLFRCQPIFETDIARRIEG